MSDFLPCPVCSGIPEWYNRPEWRHAWRTSQKRGVQCDFLLGCRHVEEMFPLRPVERPDQAACIARWNAEAERLFAEKTKAWTEEQRAAFRRRLFDRHAEYFAEKKPARPVVATAGNLGRALVEEVLF